MLSADEWWTIMAAYGTQVWPAQVVFYIGAVAATVLVLARPGRLADAVMRAYLALAFGWISVVFFFTVGRDLVGNQVFGTAFGVVALLFAIDLVRQRMEFRTPADAAGRSAAWAMALLIFAYPAFSLAYGHGFPKTVVLGSHPCPTTALGLFMLTLALPRADKLAYLLLLVWAVPFPPAIQIPRYGVFEDVVMFGIGIYALVMLGLHWFGPKRALPAATF